MGKNDEKSAPKKPKSGKPDKKAKKAKQGALTAATADKYKLYEASVQEAEHEIPELARIFKKIRGRKALNLREDFCGTALACACWVKSDKARTAIGLDLDQAVLAWAKAHNIDPLGADAARVTLLAQNVVSVTEPKVDLAIAFNFSFCTFKKRTELLEYLRAVHASLVEDGVFMLDLYGGTEAIDTAYESRKCRLDGERFKYYWDQSSFNPLDNRAVNHIDFSFPDGTKMKRAFTYDWRLWSPVEVIEALQEAGFKTAQVWWEEEDESGEGTGIHRPVTVAENQAGWICYIVAAR